MWRVKGPCNSAAIKATSRECGSRRNSSRSTLERRALSTCRWSEWSSSSTASVGWAGTVGSRTCTSDRATRSGSWPCRRSSRDPCSFAAVQTKRTLPGVRRPDWLWTPYVIGQTIIFLPCDFYLSSFFFSSPNLSGRRLDVYYTSTQWCGLSANLEYMSEMCCTRLAENTGRKISPFWHHRTTLSVCIFAAEAYIDNRKKCWTSIPPPHVLIIWWTSAY